MALTKDYKIEKKYYNTAEDYIVKEQIIKNSYIRICYINGNKTNINVEVQILDSNKENEIFRKKYNFIPKIDENSKNFIKQGYEYLKTLDEFAGAEDC